MALFFFGWRRFFFGYALERATQRPTASRLSEIDQRRTCNRADEQADEQHEPSVIIVAHPLPAIPDVGAVVREKRAELVRVRLEVHGADSDFWRPCGGALVPRFRFGSQSDDDEGQANDSEKD